MFRYPGIRSDSDMHTMGFRFRPWKTANIIAEGSSILNYLRETVEEYKARGGKVDYLKETDEIQSKTRGHFVYKFNQRPVKATRMGKKIKKL